MSVGPDLVIRREQVKYFNSGEDLPHLTDRSDRSLVKLFSVDEGGWMQDMEQVRKLCENTGLDLTIQPAEPAKPTGLLCKSCCCAPHQALCAHCFQPARMQPIPTHTWDTYSLLEQAGHTSLQEEPDHFLDVAGPPPAAVYDTRDSFTSAMLSLRLDKGEY